MSIQNDQIGDTGFQCGISAGVDIGRHQFSRLGGNILSDVWFPPPGLLTREDPGRTVQVPVHENLQALPLLGYEDVGCGQACRHKPTSTTQKRAAGKLVGRNGAASRGLLVSDISFY
jgi:hypothetical protein